MIKKVTVIWLWYVGFPLLCAISKSNKYETCGFEISEYKLNQIKNGISPIDDELSKEDLKVVKFEVSGNKQILENTDVFIICVPTPVDDSYIPDLRPIEWSIKMILPYIKKGSSVIIESTINPWVCEEIVLPILESTWMKWWVDFELAHCPERINPGDSKWNVYNINRNIWALTVEWCTKLADFYRNFLDKDIIVNEMATIKEAEATKIIENTFRDVNIAYVNELAKSFDLLGIDLSNVIKWASNKPFGFMPHFPWCWVWGHCIAVDPYYLIERAKKVWFDHKFLRNAREVNNSMPKYTVEKLVFALNDINKSIKWTKIGLMWLSYKKDVADKRESPSLKIKEILEKEYKWELNIFDPYFLDESTYNNLDEFLNNCEAIIIATNHSIFTEIDFTKYKNIKVIIDWKNCLDKKYINNLWIIYKWIWR